MAVSPGRWSEHGKEAELFVENVNKSKDDTKVEIWVSDNLFRTESGVHLTPEQARSVAAKLIELANEADSNK